MWNGFDHLSLSRNAPTQIVNRIIHRNIDIGIEIRSIISTTIEEAVNRLITPIIYIIIDGVWKLSQSFKIQLSQEYLNQWPE